MTDVNLRMRDYRKHPNQQAFIESPAKRKIVRAGRRGGKTVGVAAKDALKFWRDGKRVLYAAPTVDQVGTYWSEINRAFDQFIELKLMKPNQADKTLEWAPAMIKMLEKKQSKDGGNIDYSKARIKAKTAWNADSLRGDYADELDLDEWQLMCEDAWEDVGAPMLMDNGGNATFIYTPPSLASSGVSKARDPLHAAKMFKKALADETGRWETFHFSSHDNPFLDKDAVDEVSKDMSAESYRREILALDDDEDMNRLVYAVFKEETQLLDKLPETFETFPRYTWHDFGKANPAALFVAVSPKGEIFIYDEYLPGPNFSVPQHVEAFHQRLNGAVIIQRVGGNQTTEDEIRQAYAAHGWPIVAPRWAKVNKQIELAKTHMERGLVYLYKPGCPRLLDEIRNALWDVDKDGIRIDKIKNESRYHLLACLRYGLSNLRVDSIVLTSGTRPQRTMGLSKRPQKVLA